MNIWIIIISSLLTGILGYYISFIKEKAKVKALQEGIGKLTSEKEKVATEYRLNEAKRKHRFEKRFEVYSRYMNLLDEYDHEKNPFLDKVRLETIMSEFLNELFTNPDSPENRMRASNKFGNSFNDMVRESLVELRKISIKTNEIKLIAPDIINSYLNELRENYDQIPDVLENILFSDPNSLIKGDLKTSIMTQKIEILQGKIKSLKDSILKEMKIDLDKI